MKKMVLVLLSVVLFITSGLAGEKERQRGQFGLTFEDSAIEWFSLSGVAFTIGQNAGKNFRIELAGTYFPIFGEDVGGTLVGFSLAGLVKVTNHPRLNILVGPAVKLLGVLGGGGHGHWTPGFLFKGTAEYRIGDKWGMRAGFTQGVQLPFDSHEMDSTYMTSGAEWGFFWRW